MSQSQEHVRHGIERSPKWPAVEKSHLAKQPNCVACKNGSQTGGSQVHHIFPFHYAVALGRPDLELDDRNLVTLCETEEGRIGENHHLLLGHLGNFKNGNLAVFTDATGEFFGMTKDSILDNQDWKNHVKLTSLDEMSVEQQHQLRDLMDRMIPMAGQA